MDYTLIGLGARLASQLSTVSEAWSRLLVREWLPPGMMTYSARGLLIAAITISWGQLSSRVWVSNSPPITSIGDFDLGGQGHQIVLFRRPVFVQIGEGAEHLGDGEPYFHQFLGFIFRFQPVGRSIISRNSSAFSDSI